MISTSEPDPSPTISGPCEGLSRREQNVQKRREDILKCAAEIIVKEGVDALTLSKVAKMASVTVPTVHNLYGKKQDIYERLAERVSRSLYEHVAENSTDRLLDQIEAGLERLLVRLKNNELFFKAGFLVSERIGRVGGDGGPYKKARKHSLKKYAAFIENGDLEGLISPMFVTKYLNDSFRILCSDWVRGELPFDEFGRQLKWALYVSLLADATPSFREILKERLRGLE